MTMWLSVCLGTVEATYYMDLTDIRGPRWRKCGIAFGRQVCSLLSAALPLALIIGGFLEIRTD